MRNTLRKGEANHVTGCGDPHGFEMLRLPHFLDTQLTYDVEVVSLMCLPPFTTRKIPNTHFC
jgi:hypothetical protein